MPAPAAIAAPCAAFHVPGEGGDQGRREGLECGGWGERHGARVDGAHTGGAVVRRGIVGITQVVDAGRGVPGGGLALRRVRQCEVNDAAP